MAHNKLTDRQVQALRPREKGGKLVDNVVSDGAGLYVVVRPSKDGVSRYFHFRYTRPGGGAGKMSLGVYPRVTLSTARKLTAQMNEILALGQDPAKQVAEQERKQKEEAEREAHTFEVVARDWLERTAKARKWSQSTIKNERQRLEGHIFPEIGRVPISQVRERDIAIFLQNFLKRWGGKKVETANRCRSIIRQVFDFARENGLEAPTFMSTNPRIGSLPPTRKRHMAGFKKPEDLADFLKKSADYQGQGVAVRAALGVAPILAQRIGALRQMEWTDLDMDGDEPTWLIPAWLMKMTVDDAAEHVEFAVPLPRQAVSILKDLNKYTGGFKYVFPGPRSGKALSDGTVNKAIQKLGFCTKTQITGHGFRTTFQTIAQEAFGSQVARAADRQLGHKPKMLDSASDLRHAYDRAMLLDERRILMQRWADYLDELRGFEFKL